MQYRIRNGDSLIATVSARNYQVSGLTPNTSYRLSVASFNGFRESPRASLTVKTRGIQVKVPVSLTTGATVSLVYLEYALGLVPIGTEPKGMFGGGNRQILPAKVISSANGTSTLEITNSFNLMSDGLTMKQLPDKSFGVFEGYKALYYKGD
ncbi:fibronectin type III domain-containing protein [Limosilactobacillus fastidiosus]|uniref:Fibronectin type III domain-containing protein n=1 Tax=Limosilactobacillus fastidiosus TaxID=2759855 RepID=A0ABR6EA09_9LACO|nr:fibronectin type III domain-containing protein [Limosilactobacillus fastidiosus]MBB1063649.1 fibronectin type III domain-containing protein [Limosilactobacillus fastidiosus]MCD7084224.1 fibronectin type III domain-containing protein [Limosilactobacillus fastidiosus]